MLKSKKHTEEFIKNLAKESVIDENLAVILADKSFYKAEKIRTFLKPTLADLTPLSDIPNVKMVAEILLDRLSHGKKILIYGDYDCDGICAISLLMLFLKKLGYSAEYHIPDRNNEGYGLTMKSAESLAKRGIDILLTVDCGISSRTEISYLTSCGIEVIVTDHHELPDELPECLICNAKMGGGGSSPDICGTGIVLRIIEAMSDSEAMGEYLDIAAIATVADMVPLTGDNRIIAKLGLSKLNFARRAGIRLLADKCARKGELTASDIAFCIAPRINAAGRMANALEVPKLFLEKDGFLLETLVDKLIIYNKERQQLCDKIYAECIEYLKEKKPTNERCIVHSSEDWEVGVLGIACARLASEFNVPVILFAKKGEILKGSARSIDGVNLHTEMKKIESLCESFGGHSGACGLTIKAENYIRYKAEIENIFSLISAENFKPRRAYDYEIVTRDINLQLCFAVKELEPTGEGNAKPIFMTQDKLKFERINLTEHLKAKTHSADILAFFGYKNISALSSNSDISYYLDVGLNEYKGKYSAQALVRAFEVNSICGTFMENYDISYYKSMLTKTKSFASADFISADDVISRLAENVKNNAFFGTIFIAMRLDTAKNFLSRLDENSLRDMLVNISFDAPPTSAPYNTLLIYDGGDLDVSGYSEVILLDPSAYGLTKLHTEKCAPTSENDDIESNTKPEIIVTETIEKSLRQNINAQQSVEKSQISVAVLQQQSVTSLPMPAQLTKVIFTDFGSEPSVTENEIVELLVKIEEVLPLVNDKHSEIKGVNSLFSLLQKEINYDIIKFNLLFNILYARGMLEVINKKEKLFFLKVCKSVNSSPMVYDMLLKTNNNIGK